MVSPFRRYERAPAVSQDDELAALVAEAERRGVNIGPALALAATPGEAVANIRTRLEAEARPEVQQVRENVRANYPILAGGPERATPQEAFYGAPFRHLGPAIPFTQSVVPEPALRPLPDFLEEMTRGLTTPAGLATLPFSPQRTVAGAAGGVAAQKLAKKAGAGPVGQTVAGVAGGIVGGGPEIVTGAGKVAVRGGAKLAEEVGKTNVGNVVLPRSPQRVTRPLIYENLTPAERKLYGIESKGRLTPDEISGARDYLYGPADDTGRRPGGLVSPEDTARIQNFEERYRGTHQLAERRREVERVVAKYIPPETSTGPIAQAGFGGEMGPRQVARGAAEQARMTQAPLSEIAASEVDRIAKGRTPISQEPAAGPRPSATPPFAPTGAASQAVVSSPPVATPPRSVLAARPPAPPPPVPPVAVPPPVTPPVPPAGIPPAPPQGFDPFGLADVPKPLTRLDRVQNAIREQTSQRFGIGVMADPEVTPIMRDRGRILLVGDTQKDLVANEIATQVKRAGFRFDDQGRIRGLAGLDAENPKGPILSALAGRLPLYQAKLTPNQLDAMNRIRAAIEPYSQSLTRTGIEVGSRPDIIDGGFYFPRTADVSDDIRPQVFAGRRAGGTGFRKPVTYKQAEQGLAAGVEYLAPEDAARGFVQGVARDVADARAANQIRATGKTVPIDPAKGAPRGTAPTQLRHLEGSALPAKMADAVNTVIRDEMGPSGALERTVGGVRRIMQAGMTTLDNSWPGIQGLVVAADDPKAFAIGMKANYKAFLSKDAIRAVLEHSDDAARQGNLPTATELARYGLNLSEGGSAIYDVKVPARVRRLPGVSNAQRMFETAGTVTRLKYAYDMIGEEVAQGRTVADLVSSGDISKLMAAANRLTGVADTPFGGGVGQQVLFAARFLQARLANVSNGIIGLRSVELADIPMVPRQLNAGLPFRSTVEQRIARRALLRMIGAGVGLTVAANQALGNETDFRPVVAGRYNSNFLRIRIAGRDVSLFGTYDSLLRLIVGSGAGVATGRPGESVGAARGLAAPHIALAWDLISGETAGGEPVPKITELRTEDLPEAGQRVAQSFSPISARNVPDTARQAIRGVQEGKPAEVASGIGVTLLEAHGGKTSPLSFTDEADRVSKSLYGKGWSDLTASRQKVVRDRMYRDAPEVMLRSAEKDFAEYKLRRLNTQGVNMLRSALKKLVYARDAKVAARAKEILKDLEAQERERKRAAARR